MSYWFFHIFFFPVYLFFLVCTSTTFPRDFSRSSFDLKFSLQACLRTNKFFKGGGSVVNHGSHALFTQFLYCSVLMRQHVAWRLGIWFTLAGVIWQLRLCVHAVDRENDVSVGNQAWYTCLKVSRFFQNLTTQLSIFCFSLYPGVSGHLSVN